LDYVLANPHNGFLLVRTGRLILDTSCFKHLLDVSQRDTLKKNLRIADLEVWPSAVNVLESSVTQNDLRRAKVLEIARDLTGDRPLLPWPYDLVKRAGHAVLRGERRFELEPSGHELLLDPSALDEQERSKGLAGLENIEKRFDAMHEGARKVLQPYIKSQGLQNAWPTGAEFLENHWNSSDMAGHFAGLIWEALKLPGDPPVQQLLKNETWKMFIDAEGLAVYERAVAREQPKRVHRMDLLQLVYLSGSGRRIFATADGPLLRAAKEVLIGRFNNVRVLHIRDLLDA
jgi:hypothetical protein